ncbi:DNA-binding protein [Enterococcus faecium]|uniref:DUF536 domain-containing protein n=1 Tax=Enterococcus faecium TaxID=1352 RepID=UPI000DEBC34E|nr:DUF536 domain-containing protein [Enterococcus faecium]RCG08307.1 DNA-binding protein [Enterococcus faecium]
MTEKTIKELAEELGVSKTAINKKVSDENRKLWFSKIGNKFVINETGQQAIKSMFFNENENSNQQLVCVKTKTENPKTANQVPDLEVLSLLEQQLNQKDMQLQEKAEQMKQMQKLLDQQQQLTLQANQQIEKLQEQLQLTYTEQSSENKPTTLSEETESIEKQSQTEKTWWQFWQ